MCSFSGKMSEAAQAYSDPKWMKDIGCLTVKEGLRAVRTEGYPVPYGEWKVRVFPKDGESVSMYTYSCYLEFPDRTKVRVCY